MIIWREKKFGLGPGKDQLPTATGIANEVFVYIQTQFKWRVTQEGGKVSI